MFQICSSKLVHVAGRCHFVQVTEALEHTYLWHRLLMVAGVKATDTALSFKALNENPYSISWVFLSVLRG
jgi:hypothetical protein